MLINYFVIVDRCPIEWVISGRWSLTGIIASINELCLEYTNSAAKIREQILRICVDYKSSFNM